jgi:hypothetical protein
MQQVVEIDFVVMSSNLSNRSFPRKRGPGAEFPLARE